MAGITNRGKNNILAVVFRGAAIAGSNFAVFLAVAADAPTVDDNLKTDVTEIATGNGYSAGGLNVDRADSSGTPGFDVLTEDDTNDRALVQIEDLVWTASGGPIPASGNGARYAGLTDRNATVGSREMWGFWDLTSDRSISDTQTLTLQDCEIRATE